MKNLFKQITADFEYNEGEYYFTTTIEGKEYEITSTLREGTAMYVMLYINNEDADSDLVNDLLTKLAFEGYNEEPTKEELEDQDNFMNAQYESDKL